MPRSSGGIDMRLPRSTSGSCQRSGDVGVAGSNPVTRPSRFRLLGCNTRSHAAIRQRHRDRGDLHPRSVARETNCASRGEIRDRGRQAQIVSPAETGFQGWRETALLRSVGTMSSSSGADPSSRDLPYPVPCQAACLRDSRQLRAAHTRCAMYEQAYHGAYAVSLRPDRADARLILWENVLQPLLSPCPRYWQPVDHKSRIAELHPPVPGRMESPLPVDRNQRTPTSKNPSLFA